MFKCFGPLVAAALAFFSIPSFAFPEMLSLAPPPAPAAVAARATELTLRHQGPMTPPSSLGIGHAGFSHYSRENDVRFLSPNHLRHQADFVRGATPSFGIFDKFAALLDLQEDQRPWDTFTRVHLLAIEPTPGKFIPFATLARQINDNETAERLGAGAGILFSFQKNITLTSELIYLGSQRSSAGPGYNRETLFLTRLQVDF